MMNRRKIIDEIVRLAPSSPARQNRVIKVLDDLPSDELTETHLDLSKLNLAGEQIIQHLSPIKRAAFENRDTEHFARAQESLEAIRRLNARVEVRFRYDGSELSSKPTHVIAPLVQEANAAHISDLKSLSNSMEHHQLFDQKAVAKHIQDLIGSFVAEHTNPDTNPAGGALEEQRASLHNESELLELLRNRITALIRHPFIWSDEALLNTGLTIESLARVVHHLDEQKPDRLVAINDEGLAISYAVKDDLGLNIPVSCLKGSAEMGLTWAGRVGRLPKGGSVCIIGHVAWSGATICEAIRQTQRELDTDRVTVAVLATSTQASARVMESAPFVYHCITPSPRVHLGIDATRLRVAGGIFRRRKGRPKGADSDVVISKQTLAKAWEHVFDRFESSNIFKY